MFITLEGGEATGKSTLIRSLSNTLQDRFKVVTTREPGGTLMAEKIRALALAEEDGETVDVMTEALLMLAARQQHVTNVIKPALDAGKIVLCDRYQDSTLVYQGSRDPRVADVMAGLDHPVPDLTLLLDLDVTIAEHRMRARGGPGNKMDQRERAFHEQVRKGFLQLAYEHSDRVLIIDAGMKAEAVALQALNAVERLLLHG
jgi:dTMP kinase